MLFYVSIIGAGIAAFLVANMVFSDEEKFKASEAIEEADQNKNNENLGIIFKYSRPFFRRYITPVVGGMKGRSKIRDKYKHPLATAGLTQELSPDDFFSFKLFLIIGFPIVFLFLRSFLEEDWPLTIVPIIAVLGFFYPDLWLKGRIKQRQKAIVLSMPFIVDLLALSVEAGLDFVAAMARVIERAPAGPLTDEFTQLIKEIKVGTSRADALRNLSWRVNLMPIASFCATLIAADSVGASIGPILKSLSNEIRQERSALAEKAGAEAATKILLPLVFFILPAVMLVIAAPLAFEYMASN